MATTSSELDKVFVSLSGISIYGEKVLKWALDNFDNQKNKIILTQYHGDIKLRRQFLDTATKYYLQKCRNKNFKKAEIIIPEVVGYDETMMKLISEHGMKKLVTHANDLTKSDMLRFFTSNPDLSCKIWYVDTETRQLASTRNFGPIPNPSAFDADDKHTENTEVLLPKKNECVLHRQEIEQLKQNIEQLKYKNEVLEVTLERVKKERDTFEEERDDAVKEVAELHRSHFTYSDFTMQELEQATQNFDASSIIGKGGYGSVYKGRLRGIDVAIKKLNSENTNSIEAFKQEIAILTKVRHPNLVTLMGACYEASAIVYEYLPNGSLESHLSCATDVSPLTWKIRTRIIGEICLALIFLHASKPNLVIHGDLKPDNVLLDSNFMSKLCDFGISRLVQQPETAVTAMYLTYTPYGTPGYIDPEFVNNNELTEKSDVYSFGIIILRLLTGKSYRNIANKVEEAMQEENFHKMIDVSAGEWPLEQAEELASLGLKCSKPSRKDRPNLFNGVWPIVQRLQCNL